MEDISQIEKAIEIAVNAHKGQKDKTGHPYILHPLRVMMRMKDETAMAVAVLHDVLEDTPITKDDLRNAGISETIVSAVEALTRKPEETYDEFIQRIKHVALATRVKLADLEDNMDVGRLSQLDKNRFKRLTVKYYRAWNQLMDVAGTDD